MFGEFLDRLEIEEATWWRTTAVEGWRRSSPPTIRGGCGRLTLTNCDVHDGWPPPAFAATHKLVASGMGAVTR
jgi:hypothetical protein